MMMPAKVLGGSFYQFDSWQGYPQEREELLAHISDRAIDDVIFITGDIHLFLAGDVRTNLGDGESVALEFVGGSITSTNFGEMDIDAGGGRDHPRRRREPADRPRHLHALRGINPWIDQGDLDHHGYATVDGLARRVRRHAAAARDDQAAARARRCRRPASATGSRPGRSRSRASTARPSERR